jgi:hypothetical protein
MVSPFHFQTKKSKRTKNKEEEEEPCCSCSICFIRVSLHQSNRHRKAEQQKTTLATTMNIGFTALKGAKRRHKAMTTLKIIDIRQTLNVFCFITSKPPKNHVISLGWSSADLFTFQRPRSSLEKKRGYFIAVTA